MSMSNVAIKYCGGILGKGYGPGGGGDISHDVSTSRVIPRHTDDGLFVVLLACPLLHTYAEA